MPADENDKLADVTIAQNRGRARERSGWTRTLMPTDENDEVVMPWWRRRQAALRGEGSRWVEAGDEDGCGCCGS